MLGGRDIFASSSALETDIHYSHGYKVGPVEIERNGAKRIVKFCSHEFHIYITFIALIYPEGGLGTAKLFVGMA